MSLSTAASLSVPGRQPWPTPRSSVLWIYDGTTDIRITTSSLSQTYRMTSTFTFMHLADAFIQSDLQCIQALQFLYQYV